MTDRPINAEPGTPHQLADDPYNRPDNHRYPDKHHRPDDHRYPDKHHDRDRYSPDRYGYGPYGPDQYGNYPPGPYWWFPFWRRRHHRDREESFIKRWLKHTWLDIIFLLLLGGITLGLHYAPLPVQRVFPITFRGTSDVVYPEWAYEERPEIIAPWLSGLLSISIPIIIFAIAQTRVRSAWDLSHAVLGVIFAVLLATFLSVLTKLFFGGFRPNFYSICQIKDGALRFYKSRSYLDRSGFQRLMFTSGICSQCDRMKLKHAMTSFPSGHAVAYFAGFGFLFFWLNAKLKVWSDHKPSFWKLIATVSALLLAAILTFIVKAENSHHWYDLLGGAILGFATAYAVFRISYAGVWDWRHNHYPLDKAKSYDYNTWMKCGPTIAHSAGWGRAEDPKDPEAVIE